MVLENVNLHNLTQEYIIIRIRSEKACINSFFWTRLVIVVLNSSFVKSYATSLELPNTQFELLFLTENEKLQNEYNGFL